MKYTLEILGLGKAPHSIGSGLDVANMCRACGAPTAFLLRSNLEAFQTRKLALFNSIIFVDR